MRVAVYTDYVYRREEGVLYAERAFALFVSRLAERFERLVLVGREDPRPGRSHYRLPDTMEFVPLSWYPSLAQPRSALPAMVRSLGAFWKALGDVEVVWLLGPTPLSIVFALLARARGRAVVLGVRQDLPTYVRSRHPGRKGMRLAALGLEAAHRTIARRTSVVVVGPDLARRYRSAGRLLAMSVSLIGTEDVVSELEALARSWQDDDLRVLSVGRLEAEKNPLLLAEVLERLHRRDPRWRLIVAGEGPMAGELERSLRDRGVAHAAELRGYVPIQGGLLDLYRECHAFLHVSWTEGLPQVLFEAFAAGLPTVATDVGGVRAASGDSALLVPAGDPEAAAGELERLAGDPALRARLIRSALRRARAHTVEAERDRVAEFLRGSVRGLR